LEQINPSTIASKRKKPILVVEANPIARTAIARLLDQNGYAVLSAASVKEGITSLKAEPTLVILELMLPDGSGTEILAEARRRKLPIKALVMTELATSSRADLVRELTQFHPDELFLKPFDLNRLLEWVEANQGE